MPKEIMTVDEVAEYLDLAPATIYQKVHDRSIPFAKMKNLLRFPKAIIDDWLLKNTTYPEPDLMDEFASWHSRYLFKEWLKSKGQSPESLTSHQLQDLSRDALHELLDHEA